MGNLYDYRCEKCGSLFTGRIDLRNRGQVKFCSRKCAGLEKRIRPAAQCCQCNNSFVMCRNQEVAKAKGSRVFCSFECYAIFTRSPANPRWKNGARKRDELKFRARQLIAQAVRRSRIVAGPCEDCGTEERTQGHHDDYSKPLEVRWLCQACHNRFHKLADKF